METKGSATVFHVRDLDTSLRYYVDALGFKERFRYGDGYAGVEYGEVQIHLTTNVERKPAGAGHVYIFVDEVDPYYAEITARGAKTLWEPKDWPYGMRDFEAIDPDGNQLAFGAETEE